MADEALTFCSRYMDDVETRFNRLPRNVGFSDESAYTVDVFGHGVNLIGACDLSYYKELDKLAWYVLHNCDQAQKYIKMFEDELTATRVAGADLDRRTEHGFGSWFRLVRLLRGLCLVRPFPNLRRGDISDRFPPIDLGSR